MRDKKIQKAWEIGRRVDARFPKKLTAEAIRRLKAARAKAVTEDEMAEAECAWSKFMDRVVCAAGNYANYVMTPRLFAKFRRLNGDPAASPVDYDCRCPVRDRDGVPICKNVRPACKFAGRRQSRNALPNDHTGLNSAWYDARVKIRSHLALLLQPEDPESMARHLETIDVALKRANARRMRTLGKTFELETTTFYA